MAIPLTGLKLARKAKGLTQSQVAESLGVEQPTVQRWESGVNEPSNRYIRHLAVLLGVSVSDIIGDCAPAPATDNAVLSVDVLSEILPHVLATMGVTPRKPDDISLGAKLLRSGLLYLASDAEALAEPAAMRAAIRARLTLHATEAEQ